MATFAEILAKVNMGSRAALPFELKPVLPRPKGKATRVIITQWDVPRKDAVLHDSGIDAQGNLWYGDESGDFVGMLDPKTNAIKEYALGPVPPEHLHGGRDVDVDGDGNVWFPMRVPGGAAYLTKLDPKTGKLTTIDGVPSQFIQVQAGGTKVWALGTGTGTIRVDTRTGVVDGKFPNVGGYQKVVSSTGLVCGATDTTVECLNTANNEKKSYKLPNGSNSYGRRGKMDSQDRYWFAEYSADKLAMFDPKTEKITEWQMPKYSTPYCSSVPDRNGHVYAPSNMSDRVMRLDSKTGEIIEYLMPTELDTKEIHIGPALGNRSTILFANKRNARLVRLEVLE
jgi:streptogramin lyase